MRRLLTGIVVTALLAQSAACGFILYPERKGQKGGRIDPGIAILDAAGLLVFIVPGLIAFGVDFVTGCIYLPGGKKAGQSEAMRTIHLPPQSLTEQGIEQKIRSATGKTVNLRDPGVQARAVADETALREALAEAL